MTAIVLASSFYLVFFYSILMAVMPMNMIRIGVNAVLFGDAGNAPPIG